MTVEIFKIIIKKPTRNFFIKKIDFLRLLFSQDIENKSYIIVKKAYCKNSKKH